MVVEQITSLKTLDAVAEVCQDQQCSIHREGWYPCEFHSPVAMGVEWVIGDAVAVMMVIGVRGTLLCDWCTRHLLCVSSLFC